MNEATPPETPVWSTGVLVNFGGAETKNNKLNLSSKHKKISHVKISKLKKKEMFSFSFDSIHLQEKALKNSKN